MTVGRIPVIEGGIQPTIFDAKGDLLTATANDTPARLAVGTNGKTLVADSTASTGLKWAESPNAVGCSLYKNTVNQSMATTTITALTFDNEFFDTDAFHSTSSNTSRITIPSGLAGKYLLTASISYQSNATGIRALYFYKNGSGFNFASTMNTISGFDFNMTGSCIIDLAVGDYVELYGYQNSGGALNVYGNSSSAGTQFSAIYLGA